MNICRRRPYTYEANELGPLDVEVKIKYCGICHSDIHLINGEWGPAAAFPQVSGHEIVGEVSALGSAVSHLSLGQTVGIGWQRSSCLGCRWCSQGDQQLCSENTAVCAGGEKGGYADYIRVNSFFAFPIPAGLAPEHAAPLLCGGATVYTPITEHCAPHMRVAVVGVGGLGHMALLFAAARGCETWAISTSADKEAQCREMGAKGFLNSKDEAQLKAHKERFDVVLVTVSADLPWKPYVSLLAPRGKLVFVGAAPGKIEVEIMNDLIMKNMSIHGSVIAGRRAMQEMLSFAAVNGIRPRVELFPFSQINEGIQRVAENKARYRVVLHH
eukprot:tig00000073_g1701.t1